MSTDRAYHSENRRKGHNYPPTISLSAMIPDDAATSSSAWTAGICRLERNFIGNPVVGQTLSQIEQNDTILSADLPPPATS